MWSSIANVADYWMARRCCSLASAVPNDYVDGVAIART